MKTKIFIDGSEGTTGLRINERFAVRKDIELIPIDSELRKDPIEVGKKINESDITFLCLPDAAAREAVAMVTNPNVRILDTSTAHRTEPGWAYGFPELSMKHREAIRTGKRIAVPGCHATGFIAAVYPLVAAGLLSKESLVSAFSISGYSGAGKKAIAQYGSDERISAHASVESGELDAPREYALSQQHKHLKEMAKITGLSTPPVFSPIISDFYSGMLVSVPLHAGMLSKTCSITDITKIFKAHYDEQPFIRVLGMDSELAESNFIPANGLSGVDCLEIIVCGNDDRIVVSSRFDNLGKGASGAAVQCMNIMLGLQETEGLVL